MTAFATARAWHWPGLSRCFGPRSSYPVTPPSAPPHSRSRSKASPRANWRPTRPTLHRQARRHAVGHLGHVPAPPWRWPELWGMNLQHRQPASDLPRPGAVPGASDGYARLSTAPNGDGGEPDVRVSPRTRTNPGPTALPTLPPHLIEPFLAEPLVVDAETLLRAPHHRHQDKRVLMANGDRAYARGSAARRCSRAPACRASTASSAMPRRSRTRHRRNPGLRGQVPGPGRSIEGETTLESSPAGRSPADLSATVDMSAPRRNARRRPPAARAERLRTTCRMRRARR
jgi:hypothetical protein